MALWQFTPPSDVDRPLEERPLLTIWTRVGIHTGSTVVRNPDGSWTQYDTYAPQTAVDPNNKFFFGPSGFSGLSVGATGTTADTKHGAVSSAQMGFQTPLRVYSGGHQYVIDDLLKAELLAAVTAQHPTGYGTYIFAAAPGATFTGDEIIYSGHNATWKFGATPWSSWQSFSGMAWSQIANSYWSELGDASIEVGR